MEHLLGWETGQERFRTLTSSYYRGKGIIMVSLSSSPIFSFCSVPHHVYCLSKCATVYVCHFRSDLHMESEKVVTKKEGIDFAREYGCLFIEFSAKMQVNVEQCFEELVLKECKFW
ncbi:Ras-related protein RABC1 [Camellia lanceoleosa]|uniref:Ras-related protein RABC1 n=1 Tax=Camellia lanceoleosa TaxID=1840588 RepID=A0ACC0IMY0_9ERIC|nr:Ras-related protein RABC1 [Camellia lanceoleosa]